MNPPHALRDREIFLTLGCVLDQGWCVLDVAQSWGS